MGASILGSCNINTKSIQGEWLPASIEFLSVSELLEEIVLFHQQKFANSRQLFIPIHKIG